MAENIVAGPIENSPHGFKEAVCIHTDKVYDSCRDKECIADIRVWLSPCGQEVIDRAINVKIRKAEIIWVFTDIEPVRFNRGFYRVDLKYFFKITLDAFCGVGKPTQVEGLATYDKDVLLFGSEGNARIFTSHYKFDAYDIQDWTKTNLPKAVVETVDPIALSARVVDAKKHHHHSDEIDASSVPEAISNIFDEPLVFGGAQRKVLVTLGLFSIVKLERNVQLLVPSFDFCIPDKECIGSTEEDPCGFFDKIKFPVDEFFPPNSVGDDHCGCDD